MPVRIVPTREGAKRATVLVDRTTRYLVDFIRFGSAPRKAKLNHSRQIALFDGGLRLVIKKFDMFPKKTANRPRVVGKRALPLAYPIRIASVANALDARLGLKWRAVGPLKQTRDKAAHVRGKIATGVKNAVRSHDCAPRQPRA